MKMRLTSFVAACMTLFIFPASASVLYVDLNSANPAPPYTNWVTAATNIQDAVNAAAVNDQILVTNGIYQYGGAYNGVSNRVYVAKAIQLQSVNGPSVTVIQGGQAPNVVRCVYLVSGALLTGFTLTNGTAPSSSPFGGGVYCQSVGIGTASAIVSNCIIRGNYALLAGGGAYKGTLINCVLIGNGTGAKGSAGQGGGANLSTLYNCSVISNTAFSFGNGRGGGVSTCTVSNCIIANNLSDLSGGGANDGRLVNCTLINNAVVNTNSSMASATGGGAYWAYLANCVVASNSISGGAFGSVFGGGCGYCFGVTNCTIVGNSALGPSGTAGGVYNSTLYNCIVYNNSAQTGSNWSAGGLYYSCTLPLPTTGQNNITNAPLFVDQAGGDLNLQSNSPCINAGGNKYAPGGRDFDGNTRIAGGTVDIGAYEFQTSASVLSYAWAQQYGLPTDGTADNTDADGDGMSNWKEWKAGTNPTNALSVLQLTSPVFTNSPAGMVVKWQSVSGITYYLQRSSDLAAGFSSIQSNLVGQAGTTTFTDTTSTNGGPYFYRVGVQ